MSVMAEKFNHFKSIDRSASREKLNWQQDALCAQTDPELFFPDAKGNMDAAKKVCAKCEVGLQCLMYAIENEKEMFDDQKKGIFGGMTEAEREVLLDESRSEIARAYRAADKANKRL
jgi:WhiB family redox-sensing transcriptional regulator